LEARDLKNAAGQTKLTALQDFADKAASNSVENEVFAMFSQLDRVMMERVEEPVAATPHLSLASSASTPGIGVVIPAEKVRVAK
jgi:hypothetical protein